MKSVTLPVLLLAQLLCSGPAMAQITVLDQAQDAAQGSQETPASTGKCGSQPLSIARMSWSSAALLAEIHARILEKALGCTVRVIPGDLAATASSMGSTGQPSVAPELWVTRIPEVWNTAIENQMVRSVAPTYVQSTFEGWYVPDYMASNPGAPPAASDLAALLPGLETRGKLKFISCPSDWACSVINRNLIRAYGLTDLLDVVEPANRFEMDALIGGAVSRKEPFLFYYWQPNAVLAQLDFVPLGMGAYDEAAAKCLAERQCADPQPSAFPAELVVTALADRVFTETPAIAAYFQRATIDLGIMDELLAELNEPGASVESVADRFVAGHAELWQGWVGSSE